MALTALVVFAAISFIIAVVITKYEIPVLREKAGQNIREEGLKSHYAKAGTPSMGGISIIIATSIATLAGAIVLKYSVIKALIILLVFIGFGVIGFLDDYLKVIKKHNEGLKPKQKFGLQMIISIAFGVFYVLYAENPSHIFVPFFNTYFNLGIVFVPFAVFVVLAMTNAVNLTDGLDGLASGVTTGVAIFFAVAGLMVSAGAESVFFAALCGGCLGFLVFNKNPAKVFMGDTGSLAIGGGIAAAAISMKLELFLLIAGLIFVIEALSVVMQVSYFKMSGGKRIFKMAPIHHHFEKCGYAETEVVKAFWAVTIICCFASFMILV